MAEINTVIAEASQDLQTIEDFVNLPAGSDVRPRLLPSVNVGTLSGIRDAIFENGGLPATPFATKALMTASALADGQYAMVTDGGADNGLYLKKSGAWVKSKYDISAILAGEVLKANAVFRSEVLNNSKNLFNASAAIEGKFMTSTGLIGSAHPERSMSEYIPVSPNTDYTISSTSETYPAFDSVNYLTSDKTFISRVEVVGTENFTFTTPVNCAYIVCNIYTGLPSESNRMINIGETALPYEPHKDIKLKEGLISDATVDYILSKQPPTKDNVADQFIEMSTNLFNANTATLGEVIRETGDIESDLPAYSISDYIPVVAGDKYTISGGDEGKDAFMNTAYYDEDKEFIERVDTWNRDTRELTITIPDNVAFIRFNMANGLPTQHNRMFNEGAAALPYEPYKGTKLKEGLISDETVDYILSKQPPIKGNIADQYIKASANLFNANDVISGHSVSIDGVETLTRNYAISHYIPVVAEAEYTISGGDTDKDAFIHTSQYDSNKNFIQRVDTWNRVTRELTITIPQGVAYLRFNMAGGLPTEHNRMFNKGDTALPYEPYYGDQLTGLTLADDVLQQISDEVVVSNKDNFIFDTPIDGTFNTDQVWTQYLDFDSRKSAEIYTMYDTLVAQHPDYITKQSLGNDSIGNEIAAYKFKPARAVATNPKRSPIIYLVCGTHGGENVPPLATYLMMEQICNNWRSDKLLEALRFNVDFIIIPVSNPSGRNSGMRKNANGVDISRSFPEGFGWQSTDPESPYYGGEEPLQELESQYISQIFDENPNIDICYDFHNFGGTGRDYYIWLPTSAGEKVQHMGQVLMQKMGRKWQAEFEWLPQRHDWFAGFVGDTAGAMVQDHAKAKGVKFTATFEIARDWQLTTTLARYDQTHCKTMVEAITNWLLINLRNL